MNTNTEFFKLANKYDDEIAGRVIIPAEEGSYPLVIISHGFKSFMNWGFMPYVSRVIAEAGAIAVSFDFSLSGITGGDDGIYDVDKFSRNTVSREVEDLKQIIDWIYDGELPLDMEKFNGQLYLMGHSLGAVVSFIVAADDERVKKVVSWSSISQLDRNTERQKKQWREKGYMEFTEAITKQKLRLNVSYLEDKLENESRFSPLITISKLKIPVLLLHGEKDITVAPEEFFELKKAADPEMTRSQMIEKAGHTYGSGHPMKHVSESLKKALNETLEFLELND
ncbi:MAG: alpha/beta hydrolase family protein [Candidatus Kapaibacterium sp.]